MPEERRWHYEIEWSGVAGGLPPAATRLEMLVVGHVPPAFSARGHASLQIDNLAEGIGASGGHHAIVLTVPLQHRASSTCELHVVDVALQLLQARGELDAGPPVWLCTAGTQAVARARWQGHAGLWGFSRACRQERTLLPAWCVDVHGGGQGAATAITTLIQHGTLWLSGGSVRGLRLGKSVEPEAALHVASLLVPRLVAPYDTQPIALEVAFEAVCKLLDAHPPHAMAALDMGRLGKAYALFEVLCCQYVRDALHSLRASEVPAWHHKMLHAWCARLPRSSGQIVAPADVYAVHANLWAEMQLAERCGPQLADALAGAVAYQALLFPNGSMEAVLPVYEQAVGAAFYNGCVVAAVEAVLALLPEGRRVVVLEVGAGTGGTASVVVPVLERSCELYVFTDVSEVFLRQARVRFADFTFVDYQLLNIDADPRFQGFALHQCDMAVATNVLHATPFMRHTLRHCEQLLRAGGMIVLTLTQTRCARHGGFVRGAQRFDNRLFSISPAEVATMDPQQRLLLELGYMALHASSHRRATLLRAEDGVFLGIERPDWALAQPPQARGSVYAVTADNVSVAAGRLCFVLGLQGACSSVDTACSSALSALHGAALASRADGKRGAVAMTVSLKLVPHSTLVVAKVGMLSADGRCKTFDTRANGFVRSEGVGAAGLAWHREAALATLSGSAVRQDGRSASLTAPNGSAQRVLLLAALSLRQPCNQLTSAAWKLTARARHWALQRRWARLWRCTGQTIKLPPSQ